MRILISLFSSVLNLPSFTLDTSSILIRWNQINYLNSNQMPPGLVRLPVHCPAGWSLRYSSSSSSLILLAIEAESINSRLKRRSEILPLYLTLALSMDGFTPCCFLSLIYMADWQ